MTRAIPIRGWLRISTLPRTLDLFNQLILASTGFNFDPFFERLKREAKEEKDKKG